MNVINKEDNFVFIGRALEEGISFHKGRRSRGLGASCLEGAILELRSGPSEWRGGLIRERF